MPPQTPCGPRANASRVNPVTASFKSKEASQQALWHVVLASTHVGHVTPAPPPLGSRSYVVGKQYLCERRRNVLAVIVAFPEGPQQEARDALFGLARGALGQAVAEEAILLQGDTGLQVRGHPH